MDKYDPETKKRQNKQLIAYLQQNYQNYINSLDGDYDFAGRSSFVNHRMIIKQSLELIDNMNDGWSNSDMIAANQAGIGGSFYNYFFFTEDERIQEEPEERKPAEEGSKKKAQVGCSK